MPVKKPGYHLADIAKQPTGSAGKIREELEEFEDALEQECSLMALQELSDLIGAIRLYLQEEHPSISLNDLIVMSNITARAFQNGARK
ncbi:MAG: hypothetical protein U0516_01910 [Candidatus Saccharibacteria bacterium]